MTEPAVHTHLADDLDGPMLVSWSQLRAHEECRHKGVLLRAGKRSPAQDIRGFFHGTVVDRVMRAWLEDPARQPGQMVAMVDAWIESCLRDAVESGDGVVRWKSATDRAEMRGFCVDLVTRLEPLLDKYVLPFDFEPAKRFNVPLEVPYLDGSPTCVHLVGEMDILLRDGQLRWGVWDLKATRDNDYWRKVLGQLVFYELACWIAFGEHTALTGLIQPMCADPVVTFTVSEDDHQQMLSRIVRFATDRWQRDTPPREGTDVCVFCPVKHACSRFNPVSRTEDGHRRMSFSTRL
jgi:hypothetical protein